MTSLLRTLCMMIAAVAAATSAAAPRDPRPRLIILADMGHDPDDEQQIVHMLAMSNELVLEGLVTATGRFFRPDPPAGGVKTLMPERFHHIIDGYAQVYPNLQRHAKGWPAPDYLHAIVANGQAGNDMGDVGAGKSSAGSELIIAAASKRDSRPIHIIVNAGANTLAQALFDYRSRHGKSETAAFVARLIVYDNSGQDDAGAWICHAFPNIHWVRSGHQSRAYGGYSNTILGPHVWKPYAYSPAASTLGRKSISRRVTARWARPIRIARSARRRTLSKAAARSRGSAGDAWAHRSDQAVVGRLERALHDRKDGEPGVGVRSRRRRRTALFPVPRLYRHRDRRQLDRCRHRPGLSRPVHPGVALAQGDVERLPRPHDWSVAAYADANHHPVAALDGDVSDAILHRRATPGETIALDATGSTDPDGDGLRYRWWVYREAGERPYRRSTALAGSDRVRATLTVPQDAAGHDLHLILEVWDDEAEVPLVDYRRLILEVR